MKPDFSPFKMLKLATFSVLLLCLCQLKLTAQTTWQIGTGTSTNTSTGYPCTYGQYYSGARTEFMYTAAEMIAAGMTPGTIDQLAFNVISLNNMQALQSFNMYIVGTATPNLNTWITTGNLIYSSPSHLPTIGWNVYTLSTPFVWNGTDNIVIDICFWNNQYNYTYNASTQQTTNAVAGVNTSIWYRADTGGPFCTTSNTSGTSTTRPNIEFIRLLGPPNAIVSNPSPVCSGSALTLSADGFATGATANWSGPGIPPGTTTLSAGGSASYTFSAPSVPATTVYTYNVSQTVGATTSASSSGNATIAPLPVFSATYPNNNGPVCEGTTLTLSAQTAPASTGYNWTGPGLITPGTTATVSIPYAQLSYAGTYTVTATTPAGCSVTGTTTAAVNPSPVDTLMPLAAACSGDPIFALTGGSPAGGTYAGTGVTSNMFDPIYGTQTVSYIYTDGNGCKDTSSQVQTINPTPSVIVAEFPELCSNSAPLTLYGGVPQGGVFSGPNVAGGVFTPSGPGTYPITYQYTNAGCTGLTTQDIIVHSAGANSSLAGTPGNTETQFITDVPATTEVRYAPDCDLMAIISPTGASPISGNVFVKVIVDAAVNTYHSLPYVTRHYNIESQGFPGTATATITLYAYQSEFDAYNTAAAGLGLPLLPTGGVDNGKVRITQFHGVDLVPNEYLGTVAITPTVSWDATHNWWVMTFPVVGMSGFYIHTGTMALEVAGVSATNGTMDVYPNPAKDKVTVNISGNRSKNSELNVSDLTGRVLIRVPMDNDKAVIDMSSLASGMYMVTYSDDERKETVKITKQ